jgi:pimeloyl-ACP methyl ester carboxylesterase
MNMRRDAFSWFFMSTFARRAGLTTMAAALLLSSSDAALAQPELASAAEAPSLLPYAVPGQRVDIGGRRINLHCTGAASPTVILMAGLSSWSAVWYKIQPAIAQTARVCAFDRAGYGFSDPASRPQILSGVVDDLHAALKVGSIPGPYVLVGHSLGGLEARVFSQRWPNEVVGMVLDDTSPAGEGLIDENQPGFDEVVGRESYAAGKLHCALLAAQGPLKPSNAEYKDCSFALPSDTPAAFRRIAPQFYTAYYFADQVSLMSSVFTHRYDSVDHRSLGDMPLVVLSADNSWETAAGAPFSQAYWVALHEALAHLSSRGVHRIIHSGHEIQLEKPQVIIDAVNEVLHEIKSRATS